MAGTPRSPAGRCLAPSSSGSCPARTANQENLKVSSSRNRLESRYRRDQEAVMNNSTHSEWFASWFDSVHYHKLYAHRDDTEAARFLDALIGRLRPHRDARVLDLGCGAGRHSKHLASKGLRVLGMDLAAGSVNEAKKS